MSEGLYGLALAGGQSTRMGHDKALLTYHGVPQLQHVMGLMAPCVQKAFVSVRPDQQEEPVRASFPQLLDRGASIGPASGMLAAYRAFPDKAWLVLACDLPFIDTACVAHLCARWQTQREHSLAYRSVYNGLPEPLCAVWTPHMLKTLSDYVAQGYGCPRRALLKQEVPLLDPLSPTHLDNVNSEAERIAAFTHINPVKRESL